MYIYHVTSVLLFHHVFLLCFIVVYHITCILVYIYIMLSIRLSVIYKHKSKAKPLFPRISKSKGLPCILSRIHTHSYTLCALHYNKSVKQL